MSRTAHVCVFGASGTGKTFYALSQAPSPVLFFNPEDTKPEGVDRRFVRLTRKDDEKHLTEFRAVEYVPHYSPEVSAQELAIIVEALMKTPGQRTLIVDEAQRVSQKQGRAGVLERAIMRGRKHGLAVWMVSPNPRRISDDAVEQCSRWVLFDLPYSRQYLKRKLGEVADEFYEHMEGQSNPHAFCEWDMRSLSSPQVL